MEGGGWALRWKGVWVTGRKGVEEQIPLSAMIHPYDAEEILQYTLNLIPVCTESGMAITALLVESKSKVKFVFVSVAPEMKPSTFPGGPWL